MKKCCNIKLTLHGLIQCTSNIESNITLHLELELILYFYLNAINLSDKIIIKIITIYFNLYKHDLKNINSKNRENKEILLYIDAGCVLSIQSKKSRQPNK